MGFKVGKKEIMIGVVVLLAIGGAVSLLAGMASKNWLLYKQTILGVELVTTIGLRSICYPVLGCFNQTHACVFESSELCKLLKAGATNAALGSLGLIAAIAGAVVVILFAFVFKKDGKMWKLIPGGVLIGAFLLAIIGLIVWGAQANSWRGASTANEEYHFSGGFAGDVIGVILLLASFVVALVA